MGGPRSPAGHELALQVAAHDRATDDRLTARVCAEQLGFDIEDVVEARLTIQAMRADSLDCPASQRSVAVNPTDTERDEYQAASHRATIGELTLDLPERERRLLALRYGEDLTQAEIGQRIGVSQMHVSRLLRRTVAQLQRAATPEAGRL